VLGCFFTDPEWKSCWEGVHVDLPSTDVGPQIVRGYLSRQHFADVENSELLSDASGTRFWKGSTFFHKRSVGQSTGIHGTHGGLKSNRTLYRVPDEPRENDNV
jgi:hypothetical protein